MTTDLEQLIVSLPVTKFGDLRNLLDRLRPQNDVEKLILPLVKRYVKSDGLGGIDKLRVSLESLLKGDSTELDLSDLNAASDMLAIMQRREVKDRQAAHDALVRVGQVLRQIISGIIGMT